MGIRLPLAFSIVSLVTMIAASLIAWYAVAPGTKLAVHFAFDGSPDRYAPAPLALSIVPLAALAATLIFALAPRFDREIEAWPIRYALLWLFVMVVLAVGHGLIVSQALATN